MTEFIKFLKSIIKWILLFILLVVLCGSGFFAYKFNSEKLVTMFALECIFYESTLDGVDTFELEFGADDTKKYYLIKKKNKNNFPDSLYRGIHLINEQTDIIKNENIYKQDELTKATQDEYIFRGIKYKGKRTINRKTLVMEYNHTYKEGEYKSKARCNIISEDIFFESIGELIKSQNQGNQI